MNRAIIVTVSDLHGGHRHGLLNPATLLYDIDENGNQLDSTHHPELTRIQEYLWDEYTKGIAEVKEIAGPDPIYIIMNGDLTAGNKYHQLLVSDRIADQFIISIYNCMPWYELAPKAVRIITGTGAHVFMQGSGEILANEILGLKYPAISTRVMDHGLFEIAGSTVDVSHHGPFGGSRAWLKGNVARYYLQSAMFEEIQAGKIPPRIYMRGHYHEDIEETVTIKAAGTRYKSTLMITPSFAFIDNHTRQTVKSPARITHGMSVAEIVDGELLKITWLTRTIDIRSKENL
jgi:hypothetical protein